MPVYSLKVNGRTHKVDADADTPLVWVLRDHLDLTGTKFGCGIAECGVCTVTMNGEAVKSCSLTVEQAQGEEIVTIEGLPDGETLHPLQEAWIEHQVPQCGWCQPGMLMTAEALLREHPRPTAEQVAEGMSQVLCRCGTYPRVKKALAHVTGSGKTGGGK